MEKGCKYTILLFSTRRAHKGHNTRIELLQIVSNGWFQAVFLGARETNRVVGH